MNPFPSNDNRSVLGISTRDVTDANKLPRFAQEIHYDSSVNAGIGEGKFLHYGEGFTRPPGIPIVISPR